MPRLESHDPSISGSNSWQHSVQPRQEEALTAVTPQQAAPPATSSEEASIKTISAVKEGVVQIQNTDPKSVFDAIRKNTDTQAPDTSDLETLEVNLDSILDSPEILDLSKIVTEYENSAGSNVESDLLEKGAKLAQSVSLACKDASSGASKTLADMSNATSMAISTLVELPENKSTVISSINSLVELVTQAQAHKTIKDQITEMKGHLNEFRKNLPATEKDAAQIAQLEKGIIALTQQKRDIEENFITTCGKGTSYTVTATSEILKAVTVFDAHKAAAVLNRLSFAHTASGVVTGTLGLALNAKVIVDLKNKEAQITAKMAELRAERESATNPAIVRIIDMKLKNLEMIQQGNNVLFVQTLTSIGANVLGSTAGAVTIFAIAGAATGTVAVIGATAGIGALVLVGGALAIGAGYYAYKHREELAVYAQLTSVYAEKAVLNTQDIYSRKWEKVDDKRAKEYSMTKQRKEALSSEWNERLERVTSKINDEGSSRIEKLMEYEELDAKELELAKREKSMAPDSQELKKLRQEVSTLQQKLGSDKALRSEEVAKLASEIVMWRDLKNNIMERAAKTHTADVGREIKALEVIDSKIEGLKSSLQQNENKRKKLQDRLEDCKVSSALKDTTVDEVSNFRSAIRENIKDPYTSEDVRAFLLSQGVYLKTTPSEADIMSYISKNEL